MNFIILLLIFRITAIFKVKRKVEKLLFENIPVPYVPARVTRGALVAHRYTYAPPRCRTSQYRRSFIPLSVSLCNDLADPVFDGVGVAGFKSRANALLLAQLLAPFHVSYCFPYLFFPSMGWYCGVGVLGLIGR